MFIDKDRETVLTSTHDIPERLKIIDNGYYVLRNHKTKQFEIHNSNQIGNSLALNIPYDELDERTIDLVKKTSIQYARNIFNEMERNNEKLEIDEKNKRQEMTNSVIKDMHHYVTAHPSKDTIDSNYF